MLISVPFRLRNSNAIVSAGCILYIHGLGLVKEVMKLFNPFSRLSGLLTVFNGKACPCYLSGDVALHPAVAHVSGEYHAAVETATADGEGSCKRRPGEGGLFGGG
jgi:hypothetical protein